MDATPNLKLPYILPSQAQKHITHNEGLRLLDAVVHLSVRSRSLTGVPETPVAGDRYIVTAPAAGAWLGREDAIACFVDDGWLFATPAAGWLAYIEDEVGFAVFDGTVWGEFSFATLGIGATADATNRFAVASEASLFNHAGAGHQIKVNKAAATETASLLFQSAWTGHAEMGLNGSDDFSIKVGDDIGQWREALRVDRATGNVALGGSVRPAAYTIATLPSATTHGAGAIAFVTDATSGAQLVCSDGSVWTSLRTGVQIT